MRSISFSHSEDRGVALSVGISSVFSKHRLLQWEGGCYSLPIKLTMENKSLNTTWNCTIILPVVKFNTWVLQMNELCLIHKRPLFYSVAPDVVFSFLLVKKHLGRIQGIPKREYFEAYGVELLFQKKGSLSEVLFGRGILLYTCLLYWTAIRHIDKLIPCFQCEAAYRIMALAIFEIVLIALSATPFWWWALVPQYCIFWLVSLMCCTNLLALNVPLSVK